MAPLLLLLLAVGGVALIAKSSSSGGTIPTNAWVLQWCQLTEEAADLAASWPRAVAVFSAESVKLGKL